MLTGALRLGTRGSRLAVLQARWVASRLRDAWPKLDCEICVLESTGDKFVAASVAALHAGQGAGVFHSALEKALLADEVDVVVASCKDIESDSPQGLQWCAVGEREEVRDVLISQHRGLEQLPPGACLGTSSLRRQSQLSGWRGDLSFAPLRGNVNTRVEHALKASSKASDGVVVAAAGVHRLGMQAHITDYIDLEILLPAPGPRSIGMPIPWETQRYFAHAGPPGQRGCRMLCKDRTSFAGQPEWRLLCPSGSICLDRKASAAIVGAGDIA